MENALKYGKLIECPPDSTYVKESDTRTVSLSNSYSHILPLNEDIKDKDEDNLNSHENDKQFTGLLSEKNSLE